MASRSGPTRTSPRSAATGPRWSSRSKDGRSLTADAVVAGLGIVPNAELAERAGFAVDDGIVVDEYGRVPGAEDVFATGDVVRFPSQALGKNVRVEHEDHANSHGRAVGANAAGAGEPYDHLPFFYSDLFEFGYEAVGEADTRLRSIAAWQRSAPQGSPRVRRRRGPAARRAAVGDLREGRCGARADPRGPAGRRGRAARARRLSQTSSSVRTASSRSRSVTPPAECVDQRTVTRRYRMSMSG